MSTGISLALPFKPILVAIMALWESEESENEHDVFDGWMSGLRRYSTRVKSPVSDQLNLEVKGKFGCFTFECTRHVSVAYICVLLVHRSSDTNQA